jgi:hypothetical protein
VENKWTEKASVRSCIRAASKGTTGIAYTAISQSEAEHNKGTIGVCHGRYSSSSSSSSLGRLLLFVIPIPIPRASRASIAAFAAPSDPFFCLVRVRRSAPKACALITASVEQIGGPAGEGDLDREFVALREML